MSFEILWLPFGAHPLYYSCHCSWLSSVFLFMTGPAAGCFESCHWSPLQSQQKSASVCVRVAVLGSKCW